MSIPEGICYERSIGCIWSQKQTELTPVKYRYAYYHSSTNEGGEYVIWVPSRNQGDKLIEKWAQQRDNRGKLVWLYEAA